MSRQSMIDSARENVWMAEQCERAGHIVVPNGSGYATERLEREKIQQEKDEETKKDFSQIILRPNKTYGAVWLKIELVLCKVKSRINASECFKELGKLLNIPLEHSLDYRSGGPYYMHPGGNEKIEHFYLMLPYRLNETINIQEIFDRIKKATQQLDITVNMNPYRDK